MLLSNSVGTPDNSYSSPSTFPFSAVHKYIYARLLDTRIQGYKDNRIEMQRHLITILVLHALPGALYAIVAKYKVKDATQAQSTL